MYTVRAAGGFALRLLSHIPVELLAGAVVTGGMLLALAALIFSGNSEITAAILYAQVTHWGFATALLVALALCSVYKRYFLAMPREAYQAVSFMTFGSYFGLFVAFYSLLVTLVFAVADVGWTVRVSLWYVAMDVWLGVYDALYGLVTFLVSYQLLYDIVQLSYAHTINVMLGGVFVMALTSYTLARQYLMAIFFSTVLSMALWVSLPAIAPHQLSVSGQLSEAALSDQIPEYTAQVTALHEAYPDTAWYEQIVTYAEYWEGVTVEYGYAISSNPSMHVIWGVLLTVYFWRASRWLGCVAFVYTLLESIGTMLFLQHYLIDLPFGVLFGVLTIYVVDRLYRYEQRHLQVSKSFWFMSLLVAERFRRRVVRWVQNGLTDW